MCELGSWKIADVMVLHLMVVRLLRNPSRTEFLCHHKCVFCTYAIYPEIGKIWENWEKILRGRRWEHSGYEAEQAKMTATLNSHSRMTDICSQIPKWVSPNHGHQQGCFRRVVMHLSRQALPKYQHPSTSRPSKKSRDNIFFGPESIFCAPEKRQTLKCISIWRMDDNWVFAMA